MIGMKYVFFLFVYGTVGFFLADDLFGSVLPSGTTATLAAMFTDLQESEENGSEKLVPMCGLIVNKWMSSKRQDIYPAWEMEAMRDGCWLLLEEPQSWRPCSISWPMPCKAWLDSHKALRRVSSHLVAFPLADWQFARNCSTTALIFTFSDLIRSITSATMRGLSPSSPWHSCKTHKHQ